MEEGWSNIAKLHPLQMTPIGHVFPYCSCCCRCKCKKRANKLNTVLAEEYVDQDDMLNKYLIKLGDPTYKRGDNLKYSRVNRERAGKIFTGTGKDDIRNERLRKAEMRKRRGGDQAAALDEIREEDAEQEKLS
jgi:hypothetical protein